MVDALQDRASSGAASALAYRWLADGEHVECEWTFAELDRRARRIAALLLEKKLTGHRILLVYSPGPEFLEAFWGCLYAGAVAVPTSPPNLSTRSRVASRFLGIMQDAQCSLGLTTSDLLGQLLWLLSRESVTDTRPFVDTTLLPDAAVDPALLPGISPNSLAMLQYTSGSTQSPRGVMLTHCNLMANHEAIRTACAHDQSSVMVTWLPPYHDMGLIAGLLQPTVVGFPVVQMAPADFLRKPVRWLQAVSKFRGTTSGGPDFGYSHCIEHVTEEELDLLDLSCWKNAFNGSEVIRAETIERFSGKFEKCGFRPAMFFPCYGLAEATLMASSIRSGMGPGVISLSLPKLAEGHAVLADEHADATDVKKVISCGTAPDEHSLAIVDPQTGQPCEDGQIGEIHVSGPSVSPGYWHQTESSRDTFYQSDSGEQWLATGDLGSLVNGELIITGRLKELIIIRGRNVIPQDLEATTWNAHRALEPNAAAVFSIEVDENECVVVAAELRRTERRNADAQEVARTISKAISDEHGVALHEVVLLRPGSIPRTTSGKIQRLLCQRLYREQDWKVIASIPCSVVAMCSGDGQFSESEKSLLRQFLLGSDDRIARSADGSNTQYSGTQQELTSTTRYSRLLSERISRVTGLRVDEIRIDESLSGNGLDSLQRIELILQVEADFGLRSGSLPADECTTIETLAEELADWLGNDNARISAENTESERQVDCAASPNASEPMRLTASQAQFLNSRPDSPGCFPVVVYARLPVGADEDQTARALSRLAANQDVFRMRFQHDENGWNQIDQRDANSSIPLEWIDASQWSARNLRHTVQAVVQKIRNGFDIGSGQLAHAAVFQHGPQDAPTLILGMHHLITDAVSVSVCAAELSRTLASTRSQEAGHHEELRSPFAAYVSSMEQHFKTAQLSSEAEYWVEQIGLSTGGDSQPDVSTESPSAARGVVTGRLQVEVSEKLLSRFPASRQQHDLCVAALAASWAALSGQADTVVELENHGRDGAISERSLHGIAGWLSSRFPVRLECSQTNAETALEQTNGVLGSVPHSGLNYGFLRHGASQNDAAQQNFEVELKRLRSPDIAFYSRNTTAGIGRNDLAVRILHVDVWHDYGFRGPGLIMYGGFDGNLLRWDLVHVESRVNRRFVLQLSEMIRNFLIDLAL